MSGTARPYLAQVDATTGVLNAAWNPSPNLQARTVAVVSGTLYVGGDFTTISSVGRGRMAAYNTADNSIINWNPSITNNAVVNRAVSGTSIYIGGSFTMIGATTRNGLARINVSDASLNSWNPPWSGTANPVVLSSGPIAVGGTGGTMNGISKPGFSVIDSILATILF